MVSYLHVATIESTSHLDGRLSLIDGDGLLCYLMAGDELYLVPPKIDVARRVRISKIDESPNRRICHFEGIDDIDAAEALIGMHCLIRKDAMDSRIVDNGIETGHLLRGSRFTDDVSGLSGEIVDIFDASGNMIAEVRLDCSDDPSITHLIPLNDDLISDISDSKNLIMHLPRGIFEI